MKKVWALFWVVETGGLYTGGDCEWRHGRGRRVQDLREGQIGRKQTYQEVGRAQTTEDLRYWGFGVGFGKDKYTKETQPFWGGSSNSQKKTEGA